MRPKGRRIAIVVTALGLCTAAAAGFLLRGPIAERWYLERLEVGTAAECLAAIAKLGEVGSETALIRLHERFVAYSLPKKLELGWVPNRTSMEYYSDLAEVSQVTSPDPPKKNLWNYTDESDDLLIAIVRIGKRIGAEREITACLHVIENDTADPRMRLYFSAHVILGTADPSKLDDFSDSWSQILTLDPSRDWRRFAQQRPVAIKAMIPFLVSRDELCQDAAFNMLDWCKPEAALIIPTLENAAKDSNEATRSRVIGALEEIQKPQKPERKPRRG